MIVLKFSYVSFQFFSAGLPQLGKDEEGFDGFLFKDVLKEANRANKIVWKVVLLVLCLTSSIKMFFYILCH